MTATNHWGGRGSASDPAGELTALPRPPSWWGGAGCPSPRTSPPLSAFQASCFGPLCLASPRPKFSNPFRRKILPTALLSDALIERVVTFKLLGVDVASDLKWNTHIEAISRKVASHLYFLQNSLNGWSRPE